MPRGDRKHKLLPERLLHCFNLHALSDYFNLPRLHRHRIQTKRSLTPDDDINRSPRFNFEQATSNRNVLDGPLSNNAWYRTYQLRIIIVCFESSVGPVFVWLTRSIRDAIKMLSSPWIIALWWPCSQKAMHHSRHEPLGEIPTRGPSHTGRDRGDPAFEGTAAPL
jgi:hypothetical protein